MTLHRETPLPTALAQGRLIIARTVITRTAQHLAAKGTQLVPHEGLLWWLGRRIGDDTYVLSCVAPPVDSGPQHVFADERAVGTAAAAARGLRLGIVAQVHSHPGGDTRHSDGDDKLVLMPFESMFSIVVADYGAGHIHPSDGAGIHQFQDGRWVWVTNADQAFVIVADQVAL